MKQRYQLEIITPVHIGSGETLNHIDGYYADGRWHYIDLDKVLAHPSTDINALTSKMGRRDFRWQTYLSECNMNPVGFSAYSLRCQQSPEEIDIREAIKTPDNRPYIPGSTLKGMLRTVFLSELIAENNQLFDDGLAYLQNLIERPARGNPRRETPAKEIEQNAFGKDPNHDLLRALQVSDTESLGSEALEIGAAWTVTLDNNYELVQKIEAGQEYKNFVQQIPVKQHLTFTLKIDELLFCDREKDRLKFTDLQEKTLREFAAVCRFQMRIHMREEQDFFNYYKFPNIPDVYDELIAENSKLSGGAFMLQIGWGTGYNANTVTSSLTSSKEASDDLLMALRRRFRLGESRSRRKEYDRREFPKTRRILYQGHNPIAPLGWVKITPIEDS